MRTASLLTILALVGFSLACAGVDDAPEPAEPDHVEIGDEAGEPDVHAIELANGAPFAHFVDSKYEYCDAKVLGALWGEDTYDAKLSIGRMLVAGEQDTLEQKLTLRRQYVLDHFDDQWDGRCRYDDVGVNYEDAVMLGEFWGVDTWEAKMRVERKFLLDGHDNTHIMEALRQARAG